MIAALNNSRGQSLIQVLVAAALGVVVMLVIATTQVNQNRENQALNEKMAATDFQQQMLRSFSDGTVCTRLLTTPTALTFDSTHAVSGDPNPPTLNLP
jgi:Tfp pilus assembly protein PilV